MSVEEPSALLPNHWFEGKDVEVYFFRVNRRPLNDTEPMLFSRYSEDVLSHMAEALKRSSEVIYGKGVNPRTWRVGNVALNESDRSFSARLGGEREDVHSRTEFDPGKKAWVDHALSESNSVVTQLVFEGTNRVLAVASNPEISPATIKRVLEKLLGQGEATFAVPTTAWEIAPILDKLDLYHWVEAMDQVLKVKFTFMRPNPDGADVFAERMARLDSMEAESISEEVKARDKDNGLSKADLLADESFKGYTAAAEKGWGRVSATGKANGETSRFRQNKSVASERLPEKVGTWPALVVELFQAARRAGRRHIE